MSGCGLKRKSQINLKIPNFLMQEIDLGIRAPDSLTSILMRSASSLRSHFLHWGGRAVILALEELQERLHPGLLWSAHTSLPFLVTRLQGENQCWVTGYRVLLAAPTSPATRPSPPSHLWVAVVVLYPKTPL